jgi:hypothetical protein
VELRSITCVRPPCCLFGGFDEIFDLGGKFSFSFLAFEEEGLKAHLLVLWGLMKFDLGCAEESSPAFSFLQELRVVGPIR